MSNLKYSIFGLSSLSSLLSWYFGTPAASSSFRSKTKSALRASIKMMASWPTRRRRKSSLKYNIYFLKCRECVGNELNHQGEDNSAKVLEFSMEL